MVRLFSLLALAALVGCSPRPIDLFNGKDLTGWSGNDAFWSVRDGVITGQTTSDNPTNGNTFLVWNGDAPSDFELQLSFRLTAQNDREFANSGIQYRSKILDAERFVVGGYQADIDLAGKYVGMLYEEKGRGILMMPGERIRILPAPADGSNKKAEVEKLGVASEASAIRSAYRPGEWNSFRVVAQGNKLQHYLNDLPTADVIDDDPANASESGVIALQLHAGPPMTVEFKDLKLTPLP